jgi:hypothetical protein
MDVLAGASEINSLKGKILSDVLACKCVRVPKECTKVQEKRDFFTSLYREEVEAARAAVSGAAGASSEATVA